MNSTKRNGDNVDYFIHDFEIGGNKNELKNNQQNK